MKNISIIGTGHVGLVTGAVLAQTGYTVTCFDINTALITLLQNGEIPFYEKDLAPLVHQQQKKLSFTAELKAAVEKADFLFICVPTPGQSDGSLDMKAVFSACLHAAPLLCQDTVFVLKSTVLPGTSDRLQKEINEVLPAGVSAPVVFNPEFLREGNAVSDMQHPDRIVIGAENSCAAASLADLYQPFGAPLVVTDWTSAEMIKMGSNAFLAVKISFTNELADLCLKNGADIEHIALGMGLDPRIGQSFLRAGVGYGGSCFPKDTVALGSYALNNETDLSILSAAVNVNSRRPMLMVERAKKHFSSLNGKKAAVLGLTFKPNTNDTQNAPSLSLIEMLKKEGCEVYVYDPKAFSAHSLPTIEAVLEGAHMAFIMTEWDEIQRTPISLYADLMENPVVFDGRNIYTSEEAERAGVDYFPTGRPASKSASHV